MPLYSRPIHFGILSSCTETIIDFHFSPSYCNTVSSASGNTLTFVCLSVNLYATLRIVALRIGVDDVPSCS